ncbi:ankyrin repeat-containing protein NPR4-like isoform X2 [Actinidia eriantha]|nr:ankyrin repeat-containing protein NPR4-like isoform X2 [Actinidia eriantha]XP_057467540.1 ankyrin repeat-containing protein NPR4-like isoform X2 [Actinidia eriantha]XP_057467541.1 ankyrin repeat-containing protein NPR4-like isoform X2 [Actinidia eriantha]
MAKRILEATYNQNELQQNVEYRRYIPLVKAALTGNWESAKNFFDQHDDARAVPITKFLETALHIAVATGKNLHFVKKLVESMPDEALVLCDNKGFTALHTAALVGNTDAAKVLVDRHRELLNIGGSRNNLPIHVAARYGRKETLCYLFGVTNDDQAYHDLSGLWLIMYTMEIGFYDVALDLIRRNPELATSKIPPLGNIALTILAVTTSAFPSGSPLNFWQRIIYSCVPESCSKDHNKDDIEDQINTFPLLIDQKCNWARVLWENFCIYAHKVSQKLHFILWKVFEFAVPQVKGIREKKQKHNQALQLAKCLCKKIQSLEDSNAYESQAKEPLFDAAALGVHELVEVIVDSFPSLVWARDSENCSIFHDAIDPGAALRLQRELQWFQEVKKFVIPLDMRLRNEYNDTGEMVFTEAHQELVVEGEKWMKHTASSSTIVAALNLTVAFAAAISVPGGHNDANGLPILSNETAFLVFAISNAFSLFTSTTSLLMFLSILTSTYTEKDFLFALPKRLIIGFVTLFFSIIAMMIAFGSIVYLLFGYHKRWVLIITGVFTGIPIISFVCLEFPLLLNLITSYGGGIFGKKSNRLFY